MKEEYKKQRQFLRGITEKNKEEIKLKINDKKYYNGKNLLYKVLISLNSNYYFIGKWRSTKKKKVHMLYFL